MRSAALARQLLSSDDPPMVPAALLLDLDGTITEPMLDFPRIKAEMGIGTKPILEALLEMSPSDRGAAEAVLHRHEEIAATTCSLNPGCRELLDWSAAAGIPVALITRNSRKSASLVLKRHTLMIDVLISRDHGVFKPDPRPLFLACQQLGVAAAGAWMIGDGRYDVEAGLAAGMRTVWSRHGRPRDFPAEPWRTVSDLNELLNVLKDGGSNE